MLELLLNPFAGSGFNMLACMFWACVALAALVFLNRH
jgi:hypothetical protein